MPRRRVRRNRNRPFLQGRAPAEPQTTPSPDPSPPGRCTLPPPIRPWWKPGVVSPGQSQRARYLHDRWQEQPAPPSALPMKRPAPTPGAPPFESSPEKCGKTHQQRPRGGRPSREGRPVKWQPLLLAARTGDPVHEADPAARPGPLRHAGREDRLPPRPKDRARDWPNRQERPRLRPGCCPA